MIIPFTHNDQIVGYTCRFLDNKSPKYISDSQPNYVFGTDLQNKAWDHALVMEGMTFKRLVELYNLEKIDFLKTDCEGGEYDIFNDENIDYIKNNIKKIVGEWHLGSPELKEKFRNFRDKYLSQFNNIEVYSVDDFNIKWDLWNDHFIEYYGEVLIYIDNR